MANNIISAVFSSSNITYTKPAYQYDYGMILQFSGIELPQAYEVHFSNTEFCGESISQIGDESGVTIPDEMFLSGSPIYAWTYLHTGEDDGETVYKTVISINKRAQPSNIEPTPVQRDVITQAIAALNTAVEQTAADVVASGENAQAAANSAETAGQAKDDAVEAQGKAEDAQEAAETAQGKAEDAQQATEQAAGSVLGLTADATVDSNVGTPSVSVSVTTESDHKNMSFAFHNLKGVQGDIGVGISSVVLNADYTLTITLTNGVSYTTSSIRGEVGATPNLTIGTVTTLPEGSQATATITGTDEDPVLNLGIPVGDTGDPGISPLITVTSISGGHEVAVTDAQGTQTFDVMDGEVSEQDLEDALIDKADVITSSASGSIVTIADGGDDLPVKNLSVSLLPIQNLNGQANPYPPGGGINLANPAEFETGKKLNNVGEVISGSAYSVSGWIPVEANTDYCLRNVINSASGYAMCVYDANKEFLRYLVISGTKPVVGVRNTGADAVYARLTFVTASIDNSMLAKSSSIIPFAPYSNVCPISGWTGVDVKQTGADFYNNNGIVPVGSESVTTGDHYLRVYHNTTSKTFMSSKQPLSNYDLTNGKTYRVSASVNSVSNGVPRIAIRKMDGNQIISDSDLVVDGKIEFIFTYDSSVDAYLSFFANWTTKTTADVRYSDITFTECKVYPITWQSSAGTVYGCTVKPTIGKLSVDNVGVIFDGTENWEIRSEGTSTQRFTISITGSASNSSSTICSHAKFKASNTGVFGEFRIASDAFVMLDGGLNFADLTAFKTWVASQYSANTPLMVVYPLATPIEYTLSETQISTLIGNNSFWSNGNGTIDLEYRCDTKLYIEQLTKPSEDDMTANANIASGRFFMVGSNALYLSTVAIAQGEKIIEGTNCTRVSLADALNQINS